MQKNVDYYAPQLSSLEAGKQKAESSGISSDSDQTRDSSESPTPAAASGGDMSAVDFDNLTDKDIEAYLERIDREEDK